MSPASEPPLADAEARDRVEHDLDATLVVEAAAGTGKTTALVGRILSLVRTGRTTLARIVAVTFTEKAAGEMKLRLRSAIEEGRQAATGDEAERLERALAELEAARIGTIHGLCRDLLAERPVEAGIDPMFDITGEAEAEGLFGEAFERWFPATLADPPEGVRRLMRRPPTRHSTPRDALRSAGWRLAEHRDFDGPWRRDPFDRIGAIDGIVASMIEIGALAGRADDTEHHLARSLAKLQRWGEELQLREQAFERDHDRLEAELRFVLRWKEWRWKGYATKRYGPGLGRQEVLDARDGLKARIEQVVARCDADLAACLHVELRPLVALYEELKRRAGSLDFLDLLCRTRDLLRDHRGVRADLQRRFSHVLVDEFQDTDPLQVEIVLLLSSDDPDQGDPDAVRVAPGKLFVVGDPKQSVYRFRRADIAIYERVKQRLVADGADVVHLQVSFRSDPRLQRAVNVAFAPRMRGGGQADYVPLVPHRPPVPGRPALIALPAPRPYGDYGTVWKGSIERSHPGAVAGLIEHMLRSSGWTVADPATGEMVPLASRHVCLLFKRFRKYGDAQATDPYVAELEARDIPHVLVGGRTLHDREEVTALRNALTAIEWPGDELAVFAALKGPLFAVPDDALLAWRHEMGKLHPLRPVGDDEQLSEPATEVAVALAVLQELHFGRNRRPVADTVTRLLDATRAHVGFASWTAGDQVLVNVLRIVEMARRFEAGGATSFRAFVELLGTEADRGDASQAPVVEEGTEGVRLMTVHKAKGLEFPVVILCDMTAPHTGRSPTRHVDVAGRAWFMPLAGCVPVELLDAADEVLQRDAEESHRLLYVAATRARDVLVAPVVGDEEQEGWCDLLNPVLYPPLPARRSPAPAPGCPPFGQDSVVERSGRARSSQATVRPGLHVCEHDVEVTWWDPHALPEAPDTDPGLRRHWLLVKDEGRIATSGIEAHGAWSSDRDALIEAGSTPTLPVTSPRTLGTEVVEGVRTPLRMELTLHRTEASKTPGRPHGMRFGSLVHEVLERIDLDADDEAIRLEVAASARRLGAQPGEVDAAIVAVVEALAHPLLREAAAAEELRREDRLSLVLPDGTLVEGGLDLAYATDDGGWTVVEFKTSLPTRDDRTAAREQLGWYVKAVQAATGQPVRGVLLMV
jgi:ATP-dependent helicase/nuclease subunit A